MASAGCEHDGGLHTASLASLPGELLLQIFYLLEPADLARLQLVSRTFRTLARDNSLWRLRCFEDSTFLRILNHRRSLGIEPAPAPNGPVEYNHAVDLTRQRARGAPSPGRLGTPTKGGSVAAGDRERARIMANWDPCFPSEPVCWYDEYIQRHGPVVVNWMQLPRAANLPKGDFVEARGVALYRPDNPHQESSRWETLLAVSPLNDGSVCLWDVNGTRTGKKGSIVARSRPGILFIDGPDADNKRRSKRIDSGVTESVSVDSVHHRAFFAVQGHLIAVDLRTLSVVGCESFPWSITALSAAGPVVPLTVATSHGIHLHDYRSRLPLRNESAEAIDNSDQVGAREFYQRSLRRLFDSDPLPPYAPLPQPGPLSIVHLQRPGQQADLSDDIYVAGRFTSILHYDRRKFPSIKGSIHSGASLCGMTSLPYPFSTLANELRLGGRLSIEQAESCKSAVGGRTLIACGEYNTKGSLEIYGLSPDATANPDVPGGLQTSCFKNRQTSSSSKLLSVVNHGKRFATSDGSGYIKWFERDGFTEVRRCKIGHSEQPERHSIFASMPGSDDLARKLLPTRAEDQLGGGDPSVRQAVNDNDLLFWTGEKLGLLAISVQDGFAPQDFEEEEGEAEEPLGEEELARAHEEKAYSERMRRALERHADDVRFARNLGMGSGRRRS